MKRDTVLIVDDEPGSLLILRRALRSNAYDILTASSAESGLELCEKGEIDAVISDQEMPGMSGTEFMALMRRRYPGTARFMLTGRATLDVALDAINVGAIHHFFVKPCNPSELASALRQALHQRRLLEESRKLLEALRHQSAALESLEAQYPGITAVRRDGDGAFVIEDLIEDFDGLLREIDSSTIPT